jgi:hypothetical protein
MVFDTALSKNTSVLPAPCPDVLPVHALDGEVIPQEPLFLQRS